MEKSLLTPHVLVMSSRAACVETTYFRPSQHIQTARESRFVLQLRNKIIKMLKDNI